MANSDVLGKGVRGVDALLESLSALQKRPDLHLLLTLGIGETVITGTLIGVKSYLSQFLSTVKSDYAEAELPVTAIVEAILANDNKRAASLPIADASGGAYCIHLKDATVYVGGKVFSVDLWRGDLRRVEWFCLGAAMPNP